MGILSKLLAGKEKNIHKEDIAPSDYVEEVNVTVKKEELQVEKMLLDSNELKNKVERLMKEKTEIIEAIDEMLKGKEELIKAKKCCEAIGEGKTKLVAKDFDEYIESQDFTELTDKMNVLSLIREIAPEMYEVSDLPIAEIAIAVKEVREQWLSIDAQVEEIKIEGDALREEIFNFAAAVNELKTKHKLSHDWDGKKPAMMNLQLKLNERREKYMKKEEKVELKLKELYEDYAEIYDAFISCCPCLIEVLERRANEFSMDPIRVERLEALLQEKINLEKEIVKCGV